MPEVIEISFEDLANKHSKLEVEYLALVKKIMELKAANEAKDVKKAIGVQWQLIKMVEPKKSLIEQARISFLGR